MMVENYSSDQLELKWACPSGVMVKAMGCGIVVCEFVLQSRYYVHYEPPYPPSYGLNSTTTVLLGKWLWHQITFKG